MRGSVVGMLQNDASLSTMRKGCCQKRTATTLKRPTFISCLTIVILFCSLTTFVSGESNVNIGSSSSVTTQNSNDVKKDTKDQPLSLKVIELNSRNFDSMVSDGNIWLIEFYTTWCRHCQNFAQPYADIAASFHSSPKEQIRVAKVDCGVERALAARFGVHGFPSFYLVDGWSVYPFEEIRSVHSLMAFARGGYKKEQALPFFMSPMGPMGMLQAAFVFAGARLTDMFAWLNGSYGISPMIAGIVLCGFGIFGGLVSIVLFTILTTPGQYDDKQD